MMSQVEIGKEYSLNDSFRFNGETSPNKIYTIDPTSNKLKIDVDKNKELENVEVVYKFIFTYLLNEYENLKTCNMFYEDIEGNPAYEIYIRFFGELSIKERNILHYKILKDINEYCLSLNIGEVFKKITILLVKEVG